MSTADVLSPLYAVEQEAITAKANWLKRWRNNRRIRLHGTPHEKFELRYQPRIDREIKQAMQIFAEEPDYAHVVVLTVKTRGINLAISKPEHHWVKDMWRQTAEMHHLGVRITQATQFACLKLDTVDTAEISITLTASK